MTTSPRKDSVNGAAIVGMAGKFPGAASVDELWRNICDGVESISFFKDEELDPSIDTSLKNNAAYIKARGILRDADKLDATFFRISPREAEIMDPQQRLFLETAWEALENAGYDPDAYDGLIAVYGGAGVNTYFTNHVSHHRGVLESFGVHQTTLANAPDYLTTRVSYKLNLRGPSVSMYTGCSLSLVAVCHGFDSLMSYQCDMVLAGGVFVECPQNSGYLFQEGEMYSSDGHCRPFDAGAAGTVFSNGVGIVVLKRLQDAVSDGDHIYAVIRGTAMNNDGSKKVSFTAPSVDGQAEVIAMAQANADISPETISYIETHGTGTLVGDPIEIAALTQAFRTGTSAEKFCAIGSLKSNIGHLDAAAGIAGLIKTSMMLENKILPPSINYEKPNPGIDFNSSPFYVNTKLTEWQADSAPRRTGVSSFGVGGTNAHIVLEEAPDIGASGKSRPWQLLLLSAKSGTALETATRNLADYLKRHPDSSFADIAYTLQVGRQPFANRRMLVCKDRDDAEASLEPLDTTRVITSGGETVKRNVVFIFSGQGSQYVNMGRELYETEPVFREQVDRCAGILQPLLGFDLREVIYPPEKDVEKATPRLLQTSVTQPALFAIGYALARLWMSWGVSPEAMVGHSIGEYVAACLAGVFTLEDALVLVADRARMMQEQPGGSMLSVFLSEKEIRPLLNNKLSLAVINGPSLCVVSGEKEDVAKLREQLEEKSVTCRRVHTSHAFHSAMMDPVIGVFKEKVEQVALHAPQIPFVSNVSGTWITPDEATDPAYWASHLRRTVRFSDCLGELFKKPDRVFLEVGPGRIFSALAQQHPARQEGHVVLSSTRHPREEKSDVAGMLGSLGELWLSGVPVDWNGFYAGERRHRLPLPTYPFEKQRYWLEAGGQYSMVNPAVSERPQEPTGIEISEVTNTSEKTNGDVNGQIDDIKQALADIWKNTLGVKRVSDNDNFFNLGGNSLIAVRLFANIEKIFGKKLPLATLIEAPTIAQFADVLSDETTIIAGDSLVRIQSGTTQLPLFLVHAAGGNLLIYRSLVQHLGADLSVYGLQARGLDGTKPFHTRIEDMAAQYVREIQALKPQGPYLLAGYCMGGTIALEMAQQFHAQGKEVALLAIMETYNFSNEPKSILDRIKYRVQQIEFHARNLLIADGKKKFFQEKAKVAWDRKDIIFGTLFSLLRLSARQGKRDPYVLSSIWDACDKAVANYIPRLYKGKITQFRPFRQYASFSGPGLGWEGLAAGGLETHDLHVYPRGMLVEPFAKILAGEMKKCIQRALDECAKTV